MSLKSRITAGGVVTVGVMGEREGLGRDSVAAGVYITYKGDDKLAREDDRLAALSLCS